MADRLHERESKVEKLSGDVPVRPILEIAGAWLLLLCVALAILVVLYYKVGRPAPIPGVAGFPVPRLITRPESEIGRLTGAQKRALEHYGWIDKAHGIAHVPIVRAMRDDVMRPDPYAPIGQSGGDGT
jgi:hypothetical protein